MCCNFELADADHFFADFATLINKFIIQCMHERLTSDIKYNILKFCHYSSYGRKKTGQFSKKKKCLLQTHS